MIHLTETGPRAGTPFCMVNKRVAQQAGDQFVHVPYTREMLRRLWQDSRLCPDCKRAWDTAGEVPADV